MLAMLLVVSICLLNTAVGFFLAIHLGHGPPWSDFPRLDRIRRKIRELLRMDAQRRA